MTTVDGLPHFPTLQRLREGEAHQFAIPSKKINDGEDLNFFLASTAYRDLTTWLFQLNRSMFPTKDSNGKIQHSTSHTPPRPSDSITHVQQTLAALSDLIGKAPPRTGPRRFGNVAFRDWFKLAEQEAPALLLTHLHDNLRRRGEYDIERTTALTDELKAYLLGSFGSAQRLDYGTGHELSFLAFLGCLWKLRVFDEGEERAIVMMLVQPYLQLVRKLIMTYTLEPAGSHGVWGLDDHSFVPYVFGSAQLGPAIDPSHPAAVPTEGSLPDAPSTSDVTRKAQVADYKDSNMYFSAIQFIYDVKKGPFWEHSPVLYDISGIKDGWAKINKGMLKMYVAEVLGKFPVVQHFPFGGMFRWERDPNAVLQASTVHLQQQELTSMTSKDVPTPASAATAAPWGKPSQSASKMPQMQSSTGVPSTRAPWAGTTKARRSQPPSGAGMAPTAAPTAAPWTTGQKQQDARSPMQPTAPPWVQNSPHS